MPPPGSSANPAPRPPGRRRGLRRPATVLLAVLTALTGCTGVPDRSAAADAVSAALRAVPDVERVDGEYANGITTGRSYNVRVAVTATIEPSVLARTYDEQIAAADLSGHTLRLTVSAPRGDRLTLFGQDGRLDDLTSTLRRWHRLTSDLPFPTTWDGIEGGLLSADVDDVAAAMTALRTHAADLASTHWILRSGKTRIDLVGAYPDADLAATMSELAASGEQWAIVYRPTAETPLTTGVWQFDAPADFDDADDGSLVATTARRHLAVLAATGLRVDHSERLPGRPAIGVSVGGCRTDGSALQQQLNREFGTC